MRVVVSPISHKDGKRDLTFGVRCPHKYATQDIVSAPAMRMHTQGGRVCDYVCMQLLFGVRVKNVDLYNRLRGNTTRKITLLRPPDTGVYP